MGRTGSIWPRKGRCGFWATIHGRQQFLGLDRKEAQRKYHRLKLESTPRPAGRYSVPDLVEIYLEWVHPRVKPKTYKNYYEALQEFARDHPRVPPDELRAYHLTRWLDSKSQWNQSTRKTQGSAVKIWSAWASGEGYLDADRIRSARLGEALKREAAEPEELLRLERTIGDPCFLALWVVLYDTGARPGEIASLEASAINWSTRTAVVDGKRGQRIIGVSDRALELLKQAAAENPTGPVLRTARGAVWSENNRKNHMDKWKARCDPPVNEKMTLYACRHDLFRRWHLAGVSDVIISRQLGHTLRGAPSLTLLVSTYAHSDMMALAQAAQSAAAVASGPGSKFRHRKA